MGSREDDAYWDTKYEPCDCGCEEDDDVATEVELEDTGTRRKACSECGIYFGHIVGCPKGE